MSRTPGSSAAQTRARILGTALALFRERGFAGTSIRDLAERLHMTTAALYYHFAGKGEILDALVQPFLDGLDAFAASGRSVSDEEQLDRLADLFVSHGLSIQSVLSDVSAVVHILESTDLTATLARVERAIAGSDDPGDLLRATCAFGALKSGLGTVMRCADPTAAAGAGGDDPLASERRRLVVQAALAALRADAGVPADVTAGAPAGVKAGVPAGQSRGADARLTGSTIREPLRQFEQQSDCMPRGQ